MRDPKRAMAATVLVFEALVVVFASLVAKDLTGLSTVQAVGGGAVLAVLLVLVAGLLRFRWAYGVGTALQVALVATGLVLPIMLGVGLLFAGLWFAALLIGLRIERERAALGR